MSCLIMVKVETPDKKKKSLIKNLQRLNVAFHYGRNIVVVVIVIVCIKNLVSMKEHRWNLLFMCVA